MDNIIHCEMCGAAVERRLSKIVFVEGAKLVLCPSCYSKISKKLTSEPLKTQQNVKKVASLNAQRSVKPRESIREDYEVVSDFAVRVRNARETLGWSQKVLAEAVRENENVIKRIESGRLVPTIELARRLEKVLNIKLLEPVVESGDYLITSKKVPDELTLGDVVNIKEKKSNR